MIAAESSRYRRENLPRHPLSISYWIDLVVKLIGLAVIGLFISLVIEFLGIFFNWWELPGSLNSKMLLEKELSYLNNDFKKTVYGFNIIDIANQGAIWGYRYSGLEYINYWVVSDKEYRIEIMQNLKYFLLSISEYLKAASNMVQLYGVRIIVAIFSTGAYLFFGIIGLVEGMYLRDVRRWTAGSESGFIYHRLKTLLKPSVYLPVVFYIGNPWSIHPTLIFIPAAALHGYILAKTIEIFKKTF